MIDTLCIGGGWPLRRALPAGRLLHVEGVTVRVGPLGDTIARAEASLPRLLFGHNGRVLANQGENDAATGRLFDVLAKVAVVSPRKEWTVKRLDLACNFALLARSWILASANLRVPGIRRGAVLYPDGEGVTWGRARAACVVTLYNKARQMKVPGDVLRAEIRLRGPKVASAFAGRDCFCFADQWQVFRGILVTVPDIVKPERAENVWQAFARLPRELREAVVPMVFASLAHKPARTLRHHRAQVEAGNAPGNFSWGAFLPANGPPPPVTVEPRAKARKR